MPEANKSTLLNYRPVSFMWSASWPSSPSIILSAFNVSRRRSVKIFETDFFVTCRMPRFGKLPTNHAVYVLKIIISLAHIFQQFLRKIHYLTPQKLYSSGTNGQCHKLTFMTWVQISVWSDHLSQDY